MRSPLALALSVVLLGCSSSMRATDETTATPEGPVAPSYAAFVVYYTDATLVLPTSPEREAQRVDGLLLQNDAVATAGDGERLVYVRVEDRIPSAYRCACANQPGACRLDVAPLLVRAQRDGDAVRVTWNDMPLEDVGGEDCACFSSTAQAAREDAGDGDCGDYVEEATPVGLIGGELHLEVEIGDAGCDGAVEPEVDRIPLFEGARGVLSDEEGEVRCLSGGTYEPAQLGTARRISCESADDDDDDDVSVEGRDAMCEACEDAHEGYRVLSRGRLYEVSTLRAFEMDATAVRSERATPERCPDPSDTCGDPSGLPIPMGADFWVAHDGERALVHHGDRWLVVNRGRRAAAAVHVRPLGRPIGVRFHADARPLMTEMARGDLVEASDASPALAAPRELDADRCERDEDCLVVGICDGYCSARNQCMLYGEGCDEDHECEAPSVVCQVEEGECVEPDTLSPRESDGLAREDVRYAASRPTDRGRGWARRCRAHLSRGRIDEAYAACVRAIALDPTDRVMSEVLTDLQTIWLRRRRTSEAEALANYASLYEESAEEEEEETTPPPPPARRRRQR